MKRSLTTLAFLSISTAASAGPVLLASYDEVFGGASAPQSDASVQFVLQLAPDVPLALD